MLAPKGSRSGICNADGHLPPSGIGGLAGPQCFRPALASDRARSGIVHGMPPIPPTFIPLEWRMLAGACQVVAENERARAAQVGGTAARGFEISAETFERLAARSMEMMRPAYAVTADDGRQER